MDKTYTITINTPAPEILTFELRSSDGVVKDTVECAYTRPVDNLLLTTVDNLLNRSRLDRFALIAVELGTGIDKSSSLYRIVQSFAAAIVATR
jgi:hypothetical protein